MGTPDRPRGIEALKTLSFRDVTLKKEVALPLLTQISRTVAQRNIGDAINYAKRHAPGNVPQLRQAINQIDQIVSPGGVSLTKEEIDVLYAKGSQITFPEVVTEYNKEIVRQIKTPVDPTVREPGVVGIGYYLDLLRLLDPAVASFDNGVETILASLRTGKFIQPFVLGAMIDDTSNARTAQRGISDILADKKGAEQFRDSVLHVATPVEQEEILAGIGTSKIEMDRILMQRYPKRN